MANKHEKKQWLLNRLAESTAVLTVGVVFLLSPIQSQAEIPTQSDKKQPVIDRVTNIKRKFVEGDDTRERDNNHSKKRYFLAQWGNWPNYWNNWNNWPNWPNYWRNW